MLVVIPARAGSKRIPGKNKKAFLGKPLIQWTIESAMEVSSISKIVVTTDDTEILSYASTYPDVVFIKRPDELSGDEVSGIDPILHVMTSMDQPFDEIMLLQPTSPLRTAKHIKEAISLFGEKKCSQLVSVRKCKEVPSHILVQDGSFLNPLLKDEVTRRSQDWGKVWVLNGAIYISEWDLFLKSKSFVVENVIPFEMADSDSVDIDTIEDWVRAEDFAKEKLWK